MPLPKCPSAAAVAEFLDTCDREDGEPTVQFLQRALKAIVLANNQTRVAKNMGIKPASVAESLNTPLVSLTKFARIAEAVDCEVVIVPRRPRGAAPPSSENT